jgi:membrane fusion protein, heavy metal efflux system
MTRGSLKRSLLAIVSRVAVALMVLSAGAIAILLISKVDRGDTVDAKSAQQERQLGAKFQPSASQWASLTIGPVQLHEFRSEHLTEGKIGVDEDRSTPVFSLYPGRVAKLLAASGDVVQRGQPLCVLEATDAVQAQNDFIAALTSVNKARSQVRLAETVEGRLRSLYEAKAMPLKDLQQAEADLTSAKNDLRTAQTALEAMRSRLRILGKTDADIDAFQQTGAISTESTIYAPITGTIVTRKVGPGQFITAGSSDPIFVVGDLSTVWLVALVRESEAPKVKVGQPMRFRVLAYPERVFEGRVNYVASALDPVNRRLMVRGTVDNSHGLLKPEMFASVAIVLDGGGSATPAIPREAIIYEGDTARVWVAVDGRSLEVRPVKLGISSGGLIQVLEGLKDGDKVVTRGSLFVDRATGS